MNSLRPDRRLTTACSAISTLGATMATAEVDTAGSGRSDWPGRHVALVWWAALLLGPAAAGVLTLARPYVESNHATLVLVLVVAVVCVTGVRPAGLVAALTTALAYDFFWTEPYYRLVILHGDDILTVVLFVFVGAGIEQLAWWATQQRAAADRRLRYLATLRLAGDGTNGQSGPDHLEAISQAVSTLLLSLIHI